MIDPLFKALLTASSPPGNEHPVRALLTAALEPYGAIHPTRWTGFYLSLKGNEPGRPGLVLTAHMDSPGFIVRDIQEDGRLDVIHLGGIDAGRINPRRVRLRTSLKSFPGVLWSPAEGEDRASYVGAFGFRSEQEAREAGVSKGDALSWDAEPTELENGLLLAPHCDNRVGCYLLTRMAKALQSSADLSHNIFIAATGCEEVGGRGARIMGQMIEPEIAICFDTTYEEGSVKIGQGPAVTISDASVILPMPVRDRIRAIADDRKIPHQFEVYNYAGTDAAGFRDVGAGCLTIAPLVPSLHNHSADELVSLEDIANTEKLALALVEEAASLKTF